MTPSELRSKIAALRQAANGLDAPEKASRLQDVAILETDIHGMALDDIVRRLSRIDLPSQTQVDDLIAEAGDAANAHGQRVRCFDRALALLKAAMGMAG